MLLEGVYFLYTILYPLTKKRGLSIMVGIRAFFNRLRESRYFNLYRLITALGFIAATLLVVLTPLQLPDPDDWANYVGVQNFSRVNSRLTG